MATFANAKKKKELEDEEDHTPAGIGTCAAVRLWRELMKMDEEEEEKEYEPRRHDQSATVDPKVIIRKMQHMQPGLPFQWGYFRLAADVAAVQPELFSHSRTT